jgi:hypothetical protein
MTRAATTQKYLTTARCDGVATDARSGSFAGASGSGSCSRWDAWYEAINPMPASSMMMLTPVQTTVSAVGRLPTSGSCGQLLVYVTVSPGRFVDAAHDVQKKNADSLRRLSGSVSAPAGIAYSSRPREKTSE